MMSFAPIRLAICSSVLAVSASAQSLHFGAAWWNTLNDVEKEGFITGYEDSPCSPKISAPDDEIRKFIDVYLQSHPKSSVPSSLQIAAHEMKPWKVLKGGEVWTDAHGFMDGEWWGDTNHGDQMEQIGYVRGYLACKHQPVSDEAVRRYAQNISRYYDSPKHAQTKIAHVLEPPVTKQETH